MPMQELIREDDLRELTEEDFATIVDVFNKTRIKSPGLERPGIVTFKGPETFALFKDKGVGDIDGWNTVVKLGRQASLRAISKAGHAHGKPYRVRRLFIRLATGSRVYPRGIPVGILLRSQQRSDGSWHEDNSLFDIHSEERDRIKQLARGFTWMSQPDKRYDADMKAERRRISSSGDADAMAAQFRNLLGVMAQGQTDAARPGEADLGAVATKAPPATKAKTK